MYYNRTKILAAIMVMAYSIASNAQDKIIHPDITYAGTPRTVVIDGLTVSGMDGYEDYMLTSISGLAVGQRISVPGTEITDAVKRYWKHGLFSDVSISADSLVGNKIYLNIALKPRPRVSEINYIGLKKTEREDMEKKLGMIKGGQITPNMIDRAKILAKKYFDDKGFKNADIDIRQRNDVTQKNQVILDVVIDKKEKMKVRNIIIDGNESLKDSKIKGGLFTKGAFAKTHEAGKLSSFLKAKKFTPERWKEDKKKLIEKYNELGYRDATILKDSVWNVDPKHVSIYIKVDEGQKYYIRNIHWVGNTVYTSDFLGNVLGMESGDVYNQKLMGKRLTEDDDAVGNLYYNHGYVFSSIQPTEVNIVGDSIDLEMRVMEGPQAHLSHVRING
ncbi:MAG: POTRA domain-containing protein, partial [Prevotella sp.]|nr:POTRA domain-containing protein [Prevotella sp.]